MNNEEDMNDMNEMDEMDDFLNKQRENALFFIRQGIIKNANRMMEVKFEITQPSYIIDDRYSTVHENDVNLVFNQRPKYSTKLSFIIQISNEKIDSPKRFKNWVKKMYDEKSLTIDKPIETISDELYDKIAMAYPKANVTIKIWKDDDYGCCITYNQPQS